MEDLSPTMQAKAEQFIILCEAKGIEVLVYCSYRSAAEQMELYALGRTKPGRVVTWTLSSKHNLTAGGKPAAKAFDCVPLKMGKPDWDAAASYKIMGDIGASIGLIWGGRWKGKDTPHFELP